MERGTNRRLDISNREDIDFPDKLKKILDEAEKQEYLNLQLFSEHIEHENPEIPEIQNPNSAYELYYKKLEPLKRQHIPKGKVGRPIRDQINLYLKEGHITGRDGRQAYTRRMAKAIEAFVNWINKYNGQNVFELFIIFKDLNEKHKDDTNQKNRKAS